MRVTGKLLSVLLVASACFNIFFVTAYLRTRAVLDRIKTEEGRMQLLAKRLNLTGSQEGQVIRLRRQLRGEVEKLREADGAARDAFWAEMVKDEPDPRRIEELLGALAAGHEKTRMVTADFLREIFALLTPEQRRDFVKVVRERDFFGSD